MKKKIIYVVSLVLIAWSLTSCEALFKNCKFCKQVTYENGNVINSGSETEYCGADLVKQQAIPDVTIGALTTKVECR